MQVALALASRGLGNVWPNPAVGCLLVREDLNNQIVGRGWTQPGGRPHAETEAILRAGQLANKATAYVTLEPCDHQGQTGPCSQALIDAGITRVVIATTDPDPRVSGRGVKRLEAAGMTTSVGLLCEQARTLNRGFFSRIIQKRPFICLKTATTLDGCIATSSGQSQWITGPEARKAGHLLRARHDGILTGIGTVLADDPELTCRLPGLQPYSPVRIVLDPQLKIATACKLVRTAASTATWVITSPQAEKTQYDKVQQLQKAGVDVFTSAVSGGASLFDLSLLMQELANRGLTRLLVEAGSSLTTSFLQQNLVDQIKWFRAPVVIGADGVSAIGNINVIRLNDAKRYSRLASQPVGDDILDTLELLD